MRVAALVMVAGLAFAEQSAVNVSGKWVIQPQARGGGPGVGRGGGNAPAAAGNQGGANAAIPPPANRGAGPAGSQGGGVGGFGGGGGRGGQTLTLNQVGSSLTGELVGGGGGGGGSAAPINNEIFSGKVEGTTVTFYVWRGTDKPYKVTYTGTVNTAGDEITFTVTGAPARGAGPGAPAAASPTPTIARRSP